MAQIKNIFLNEYFEKTRKNPINLYKKHRIFYVVNKLYYEIL